MRRSADSKAFFSGPESFFDSLEKKFLGSFLEKTSTFAVVVVGIVVVVAVAAVRVIFVNVNVVAFVKWLW